MRFLESISRVPYRLISIILMLIGIGIIILGFINTPLQLQIAVGFTGLGFTLMGLVLLKRAYEEYTDEQRFNQIVAKLDEIQQELKEELPRKKSGTVIADIITTGLKYYTDQVTGQKDDD